MKMEDPRFDVSSKPECVVLECSNLTLWCMCVALFLSTTWVCCYFQERRGLGMQHLILHRGEDGFYVIIFFHELYTLNLDCFITWKVPWA